MVPRGSGMLTRMKNRKGVISGMLLVSVYAMDFFRLSKIRRPVKMEVEVQTHRRCMSPIIIIKKHQKKLTLSEVSSVKLLVLD